MGKPLQTVPPISQVCLLKGIPSWFMDMSPLTIRANRGFPAIEGLRFSKLWRNHPTAPQIRIAEGLIVSDKQQPLPESPCADHRCGQLLRDKGKP